MDGNNQVTKRFVYATRWNVPDTLIVSGVAYRLITDRLGSVRRVVRVSDGTAAQVLAYDEFGRVLSHTNPGFQPFGFAGGLYDPLTGLTRFGAREYDPSVGRWTSKDPILFAGGDPNLYGYVLNDPVNGVDPSGLWVHIIAGATVGGLVSGSVYVYTWANTNSSFSLGELFASAALGAVGGALATATVNPEVGLPFWAWSTSANAGSTMALGMTADLLANVLSAAMGILQSPPDLKPDPLCNKK